MDEIIVGIDLGTTNSEIAVLRDGKVTVIDINGNKILPSAVGMSSDGKLLVGEAAKNQYIIFPEHTILSIKRRMGREEKITMGGVEYLPQEISAMILRQLKLSAETYLECSIKKAVITVPAYFSDAQRQATREAGELAGLEVVRIINEPTAAALAYGVASNDKKTILVYDLGGGTFDLSVVSLNNQIVEVLASTGNNRLGGDDFDEKIIQYIEDHLKSDGIDINSSIQATARIRRAAEMAKITLSDHPFALIEEEFLLEHKGVPYHLSLELSRKTYEDLISPLIEPTLNLAHEVLNDAKLMSSDIDEVLLVGGSTRTPLIIEKLAEIFNSRPRAEIDQELCVAMGAAIQAGIIAGQKCNAVFVDVTPYTFGTSYLGFLQGFPYPHIYKPIILKNTPIPVTKSEVFFTMTDQQERIEVKIYQGEDKDAIQNTEIGSFMVEGLSKVPQGSPIILNFRLDLDGILHVTAKEKCSGLEKKIVLNNVISRFEADKMIDAKKHIEQLFIDAPDNDNAESASSEIINGAITKQSQTTALDLIKKAQQCLDTASSEDQEDLVNLIEDIQEALDSNDPQKLKKHVEKVADILFYLKEGIEA